MSRWHGIYKRPNGWAVATETGFVVFGSLFEAISFFNERVSR